MRRRKNKYIDNSDPMILIGSVVTAVGTLLAAWLWIVILFSI